MGLTQKLTAIAGQRNTYAVVDVADDTTTVFEGRCRLLGVIVNTNLSAHGLPIKDDTTTIVTLPASANAGDFFDCFGVVLETSLVVDPDNAGTGNVTVVYEPIRDY